MTTPRQSALNQLDGNAVNRRHWLKLMAGAGLSAAMIHGNAFAATTVTGASNNILLYSGWATHNIGDIGHTPGTLRYLEQYLPEAKVSCWLRKSNDAVLAMLQKRFPKVTFVQGTLDGAGRASTPELQTAFDSARLFLYNSGMHFTRYWQPPSGLVKTCLAKGKRVGLYGQSFDGFRDEDAATLPGLLSQVSFIFTRDTESLLFLRSQGVKPPVLEFGPDGCFGIDVRDDAKADAFVKEHGLEPRKFLAVILRTDREVGANKDKPDAADAVAGGPDMWAAKLREVITEFVKRPGYKVVLVPEVEKEIGPAKKMLLDPLPEELRAKVVHRDHFWNSDEAVSLYAKAFALVAVEPHSCIMALANGTPAIHFFTRKHGYKAWMFRDIGLSEWLIDIDTEPAERVTLTLNLIHNNYDLALSKTKRAMDFVNARSKEMMGDVGRALKAG
jgi:polysaccharide pyruvyl transferase WcaK-like protein